MSTNSVRSTTSSSSSSSSAAAAASASTASKSSPNKRSKSQATTTTAYDDDVDMLEEQQRNRKVPRTPPKPNHSSKTTRSSSITDTPSIVTPSSNLKVVAAERSNRRGRAEKSDTVRRVLGIVDEEEKDEGGGGGGVNSKILIEERKETDDEKVLVVAKKKLPFGAAKEPITIPPNVQAVYSIIQKYTGCIGGNGNGGAIYGELTAGSMQKMINLMVEHTGFSKDSRFIDVGCGLAKPSLHVAQYPGVEFSYGIEVEHVRYMLGMSNLEQVLKAALRHEVHGPDEKSEKESTTIGHKCILSYGDITEAKSFDPFTHVYMFDVG